MSDDDRVVGRDGDVLPLLRIFFSFWQEYYFSPTSEEKSKRKHAHTSTVVHIQIIHLNLTAIIA